VERSAVGQAFLPQARAMIQIELIGVSNFTATRIATGHQRARQR